MKRFFNLTVPALLLASACSDIELDPYWSEYDLPDGPALGLRDIDASDDGAAWVVGLEGEAWYYDGELWYERNSGFDYELTGVAANEDGGCWAVGADTDEEGHILRFDPDEGWTEVELPGTPAFLADVDCEPNGAVCAVGSNGEIWRWTPRADTWEIIYSNDLYMWRAISAKGNRCLVVGGDNDGDGALLWVENGDAGVPQTCEIGRLEDVELFASDEAWLLAVNGVVLYLSDGDLDVIADIGYSLLGLVALADDYCLAGGVSGLLYRIEIEAYWALESGTTENIHDIVLLTEAEGWAAAQTHLLGYR